MVVFVVVAFVMDTYVVWPKSLCFASQITNPRVLPQKPLARLKLGKAEPRTAGPQTRVTDSGPVRHFNTEKITSRFKQNDKLHDENNADLSDILSRPPPLRKKTALVRLILSKSLEAGSTLTRPAFIVGNDYVPVAPLWWDKEEGAYMIKMRLGAGPVELVLDTGSSQISAKGEGCLWTSCEEEGGVNGTKSGCITQSCPCGNNGGDASASGAYALTGQGTSGPGASAFGGATQLKGAGYQNQGARSCSDFYYHPTGTFVNPGEHDAGTKTTLVYGSQQDTISHYLDAVSLPCMSVPLTTTTTPNSNTFVLLETPSSSGDDERSNNEYMLGNMIVHFVHHIEGASSSNLLGMARPPKHHMRSAAAENGKFVTVDKLLLNTGTPSQTPEHATRHLDLATFKHGKSHPAKHEQTAGEGVWSVVLKKQGGWFAVGSLAPLFPAVKYIDMVDPPQFDNFVTHFYVAKIWSFEVGPRMDALVKVKTSAPQFCVFDTGTTYTYGCTKLGAQLSKMGYHETTWYMRLTLGSNRKELVTLAYSPHELVDPDFPTSSVFQCEEGRTLPDFDVIFPNPNVLLFGALMMQNFYWEFDLGRQKIGVQATA